MIVVVVLCGCGCICYCGWVVVVGWLWLCGTLVRIVPVMVSATAGIGRNNGGIPKSIPRLGRSRRVAVVGVPSPCPTEEYDPKV